MSHPADPTQYQIALAHARLYLALRSNARNDSARALELLDQVLADLAAGRDALAARHGLPAREAA